MLKWRSLSKLMLGCVVAGALLVADTAHTPSKAQDSWLNWDEPQRRAPRRKSRPQRPRQEYRQQRGYQRQPVNRYCADLELRLAQLGSQNRQAQNNLPALKRDFNKARATYSRAVNQLERRGCYEQFFFSKTLRQTRQCIKLDRQAGKARRRVAQIDAAIQRARGGVRRGRSEVETQLINELARNRCGENYTREARRRAPSFFPFWQDQDAFEDRDGELSRQNGPVVATYRTMCVRRCDGYYFPVSFSTTQRYFGKDENVCQQKCAAPADLFVYRNPGEEPDQMRSIDGRPYSKMPNAFLYRKEYVKGCSCNVAQYNPNPQAEPKSSASPAQKEPGAAPDTQSDRRVEAKPLPAPQSADTQTANRAR